MPLAQPISAVDAAGTAHRQINLNGLGLDWSAANPLVDADGNIYPASISLNTWSPADLLDIENCHNNGLTLATASSFAVFTLCSDTNVWQVATAGSGYAPLAGCWYVHSGYNGGLTALLANPAGDVAVGTSGVGGGGVDGSGNLAAGAVLYILSGFGLGAGRQRLGVLTPTPLNTLDVAGNMVIGADTAGTVTAPTNGLAVEGQIIQGYQTSPILQNATLALWVDETNNLLHVSVRPCLAFLTPECR